MRIGFCRSKGGPSDYGSEGEGFKSLQAHSRWLINISFYLELPRIELWEHVRG